MKSETGRELRPDEIREAVSKEYGQRVSESISDGCCCGARVRKGALAEFSGYKPDEIAALPEEAVVNSFGCGNPVALAGLKPGDVVLDLGCGAGIDLLLSAGKVGPTGHVIGVDMTDDMIVRARENIRKSGLTGIEVRKGVIEKMPVDSASVDWVISNCVINLSPEKPKVFDEIARVLKPGGQMFVSDIVAHDLPAQLRESAAFYASCIGGAIPEEEYLAGLRAAGLTDVEVRDRFVYDADQLYSYAVTALEDDTSAKAGASSCGCGAKSDEKLHEHAKAFTGKVWSAKVYARKPL